MSRTHFLVIVLFLSTVGLSMFLYKSLVLGFPLLPDVEAPLWSVEARVSFVANNKPTKVSVFIPTNSIRAVVMDESFISSGYGLTTSARSPNRKAIWSIRKAYGRQDLYYRAVVRRLSTQQSQMSASRIPKIESPDFKGARLAAVEALLKDITSRSADTEGLVLELLSEFSKGGGKAEHVKLLLGRQVSDLRKAQLATEVLSYGEIPARMVHGIRLTDNVREAPVLHWIEVFDTKQSAWEPYDLVAGKKGLPSDYFPWWRGSARLADGPNGQKINVSLAVERNQELAITSALAGGKLKSPMLLEFSLFSLPIQMQAVYRILVMIPLGAFLIVILRNVIGIRTFGTFMPVLVALAFRETELVWGIALFTFVVSLGLGIRFYLERLKLLLVPRLAAVLIVVILLMIVISVLTHKLGIDRGLSVALFPMIIMTMTIERMSIIWEEQGASDAVLCGVGSMFAAVICYLLMNFEIPRYLFFVFPELLLVLLAITLLLGRYTGYRCSELLRFKAFVEDGA